jgi:ribosomal protein S18 acetylase RimI-like enzyme
MSITVRKVEVEDLDALERLWSEFIDYHKEYDDFFTRSKAGHKHVAKFIRENMDNPDWLVLVAEEDDTVIGYCMSAIMTYPPIFQVELYGFIQDMAVTESHRRRGAGSLLLKGTLAWFRRQGVSRVEVQVASTNPVSQAFWRAHGFRDYITRLTREA